MYIVLINAQKLIPSYRQYGSFNNNNNNNNNKVIVITYACA